MAMCMATDRARSAYTIHRLLSMQLSFTCKEVYDKILRMYSFGKINF